LQRELIEEVAATGTPTVVVVVGGRVFSLPSIADRTNALVEAWCPGEEEGNAVADVLCGAASPSGRLPVTIPRSAGHVPCHYNHLSGRGKSQMLGDYTDAAVAPLFPFGHGLSYTTFEYGGLALSAETVPTDGAFTAGVEVRNTGERAGDEVVQLTSYRPSRGSSAL
jgi:beta-glucosidase